MENTSKKRSFNEWVNDKKKEKQNEKGLKDLRPQLENADFLVLKASLLVNGYDSDGYKEAITLLSKSQDVYKVSTEYTKDYYYNLLCCQRLLVQAYAKTKQYESAYQMSTETLETQKIVSDNKLMKSYDTYKVLENFYEHAKICVKVNKIDEAVQYYINYINGAEQVTKDGHRMPGDNIEKNICDCIEKIYHYSNNCKIQELNIDQLYTTAFSLIVREDRKREIASRIANSYAMNVLDNDKLDKKKATSVLIENYRYIKSKMSKNALDDKIYFDMAITSCNLERLFKLSNDVKIVNKMNLAAKYYLPKAMDSYKVNTCEFQSMNANDVYKYIIDTLRKDYIPTLSLDEKQNAVKDLDDYENKLNQESRINKEEIEKEYDFDI